MRVIKQYKYAQTVLSDSCKDIVSAESVITADIAKYEYIGLELRKGNKRCGRIEYSTGYANLQYVVEDKYE